uniref:Mitochondrial carrier protein n=1 Tax=Hemiselmis andersenii TaxID=464988 RepID=A0A6U4KEG7_HEMAN|mmetsp:Transcript_17238/g.39754  ORF Transcript_17238/g.39754 Transcript_17238/m.39754 type:complete len:338 (-) Transcript_17238:198-1211(-)|eukprot:CAMPEP_0114132934 /NCGR_PEP_ID=MMETSP0043_2-20121206/13360_1 /TAXON_ID=464988 /ORGANISM="Hemiselmis andersenii, Strain CCMP644" /LENGTH=337 /DNA_ID=CAMNT_0001226483 /DNA_START=128 /DNA_END=1141 /DNA_ORIENTATION=+
MFSRRTVAAWALAAFLLVALVAAEGSDQTESEKPKPPPPKKPAGGAPCSFKGGAWKNSLSQTEKMWAGSLARLCAQTLLHPLDTIRTRRQAAGGLTTTPKDMLKGLVPQMLGAMPAGALQFIAYEQTKTELNSLCKNQTLGGLRPHLTEICAAAVGAAAASLVRVPQERVKQPIQADLYPNMMAAINANLKSGGLKSFYTGFTATILRDIPWNTLSFFFFNIFKTLYESMSHMAPNQRDTMAIGAVGGALAAIIMTPVDVVKTRLMLQKVGPDGKLPYMGIIHALFKISKDEGPGALMKGLTPRMMYLGPLAAITMSIYEKIGKKMLLDKGPNWCKK